MIDLDHSWAISKKVEHTFDAFGHSRFGNSRIGRTGSVVVQAAANRNRIIEAAITAFAADPDASMDDISKGRRCGQTNRVRAFSTAERR